MIEVKWGCECGGVEIKVFVDGGAEDGAGKVCELNRRLFEMKELWRRRCDEDCDT